MIDGEDIPNCLLEKEERLEVEGVIVDKPQHVPN